MLLEAGLRLTIISKQQMWLIYWRTVHTEFCQIRMSTDIFFLWVVGQNGVTMYTIYPLVRAFWILMCQLLSVGISPWTFLKIWFAQPATLDLSQPTPWVHRQHGCVGKELEMRAYETWKKKIRWERRLGGRIIFNGCTTVKSLRHWKGACANKNVHKMPWLLLGDFQNFKRCLTGAMS